MPVCPNDGTPLDDKFGSVVCPACKSTFFVDMEGQIQVEPESSSQSDLAPSPFPSPSLASPSTSIPLDHDDDGPPVTTMIFDEPQHDGLDSLDSGSSPIEESPVELQSMGDISAVGESPAFENPVEEAAPFDQGDAFGQPTAPESSSLDAMDQFFNYSDASESMTAPGLGSSSVGAMGNSANDPLGIQDYANSEFSQAKDGPFLFRILISGIDSKEIRESLREALEDNRFAWDVDAIMRQITKGELKIENVSPVKATIVINRIKRLPLRIRWEQYAVTQAETY